MDHKWLAHLTSAQHRTTAQRRLENSFILPSPSAYFGAVQLLCALIPPRSLLMANLDGYNIARAQEVVGRNNRLPGSGGTVQATTSSTSTIMDPPPTQRPGLGKALAKRKRPTSSTITNMDPPPTPRSNPAKGSTRRKRSMEDSHTNGIPDENPETKRRKSTQSQRPNLPPLPLSVRRGMNLHTLPMPPPQNFTYQEEEHHASSTPPRARPHVKSQGQQQTYFAHLPFINQQLMVQQQNQAYSYQVMSQYPTPPQQMTGHDGQVYSSTVMPPTPSPISQNQQNGLHTQGQGNPATIMPPPPSLVSRNQQDGLQQQNHRHSSTSMSPPPPPSPVARGQQNRLQQKGHDHSSTVMPPPPPRHQTSAAWNQQNSINYPSPTSPKHESMNSHPQHQPQPFNSPSVHKQQQTPQLTQNPSPHFPNHQPSPVHSHGHGRGTGHMPPPNGIPYRLAPEVPLAPFPSQQWMQAYLQLPPLGSADSNSMDCIIMEMMNEAREIKIGQSGQSGKKRKARE